MNQYNDKIRTLRKVFNKENMPYINFDAYEHAVFGSCNVSKIWTL